MLISDKISLVHLIIARSTLVISHVKQHKRDTKGLNGIGKQFRPFWCINQLKYFIRLFSIIGFIDLWKCKLAFQRLVLEILTTWTLNFQRKMISDTWCLVTCHYFCLLCRLVDSISEPTDFVWCSIGLICTRWKIILFVALDLDFCISLYRRLDLHLHPVNIIFCKWTVLCPFSLDIVYLFKSRCKSWRLVSLLFWHLLGGSCSDNSYRCCHLFRRLQSRLPSGNGKSSK